MSNRFALLIGNAAYRDQPLSNPAADVKALAGVLTRLGFVVTAKLDQSHAETLAAIDTFSKRFEDGCELGIFFFAGHGCELGNNIFLLPVDAPVSAAVSTLLNFAISLTQLEELFKASKSPLVLLTDTCRDQLDTDGTMLPDAYKKQNRHTPPPNSIYVFSTASGNEASDGKTGETSPFVSQLIASFSEYQEDIEALLRRALAATFLSTNGKQRPRLEGTLHAKVPLSSVPRLTSKGVLTAHGVRDLYGLAQHPSGIGVLGWNAKNMFYNVSKAGAFPWLRIKSDEILCTQTEGNLVWIAFKSDGKTFLGKAESINERKLASIPSIEIELTRVHTITVDFENHRVYVAGKDETGGKCVVYFYEETKLQNIIPERCEELYIATAIDKERVLLGGPDSYLAAYFYSDNTIRKFNIIDPKGEHSANFYSFAIYPDRHEALAGSSGGELHLLDLHSLSRRVAVILPSHWQKSELYEALGEIADEKVITQYIDARDTLEADDRSYLDGKLPTNNIVTLIKSNKFNNLIACSDIGRLYNLATPDMKLLDFNIFANGRSSAQAVIDSEDNIFVDAGDGNIAVYQLLRK